MMPKKTTVKINARPAIAPITIPAIAPPERDGELFELEVLDVVVGVEEGIDCDVAGTDIVADVDEVDTIFTPNLASIVIGIVLQQEVVRPQHQVVEFAVPSQGDISTLPLST
jgi:hypothetical protein